MMNFDARFSNSFPAVFCGRSKSVRFSLALVFLALILSACSSQNGMADKDSISQKTIFVNSANQDTRVRIIVIHHTSEDFAGSLSILTRDSSNPVSSHYLIPEPFDPSYTDNELKLYQLVPEEARAWHAGGSYWDSKTSLNDMSVGIEIVNRTYCRNADQVVAPSQNESEEARICFYPDFAESQIVILTDLLKGLLERHTEVTPTNIVGHSDIAPQRKIDPGPRFPWQRLFKLGYGAWFDDETVVKYWQQFRLTMPPLPTLQTALHEYGYDIDLTGIDDEQTRNVVRAFQLHFLPYKVTRQFDAETAAILYALLEKYHPERLEKLSVMDATNTTTVQP